jgi:hypothetical protein
MVTVATVPNMAHPVRRADPDAPHVGPSPAIGFYVEVLGFACERPSEEWGWAALARDSVYTAVMLICTGVVSACVLVGALRHREQSFRLEWAGFEANALRSSRPSRSTWTH